VPHTRDDRADRELLGRLASGQREALGELYDRHGVSLFRHAVALTRRQAEAEDLVHAVFVKLATTGADLLGVRAPSNYLHRMLKSIWLDGYRRARTSERLAASIQDSGDTLAPGSPDDRIDINRALDALPPLQREVIVLHLVEGYSFIEVGRLTGVSLFTAAARYRLGIVRLRKMLARPVEVRS
jgi:RNA polymerase sigma-70 factor (ECF subfamily)